MPIDYIKPPLGYLVRLPAQDDAADLPLNDSAKLRAEDAARFLSFGPIGSVVSTHDTAAIEMAEIIHNANACGVEIDLRLEDPETLVSYLIFQELEDRGLPYVLVTRQSAIAAAFARMGVSSSVGDSLSVTSYPEIVDPGGVISIHRGEDGKIVVRARTLILDFGFTDYVGSVANAAR